MHDMSDTICANTWVDITCANMTWADMTCANTCHVDKYVGYIHCNV